ncbi:hypothetical protein [Aneurinibacillus migulanus]|uniref:Uncharacterized protein n=1 Tax=Aneurinibacillus migulanus TaxID=47500 RepID=A0A0D1WK54_ANEMI|nr:hypothetical protein [Aneurinibacillus migulanus]KIV59005.1 hypothetical protein TS65_03475 [Aneurinibacillus migulanus]KON99290.1 hypothetical protein AF333_00705 [Aneurinibacillus migulanus]MED0893272.1 hypothetical protein [Aneurinibacillus migulanus]MED1615423.1 hypothetical protein [Aneurinibacillus migulanus]SDI57087.1 hypothetical protein SAMN04487909_105143 [Aneurinibacillus migulanus]
MNRWLQSPMRIKRIYILIGGSAIVLIIALTLASLFMKSGDTTSNGQTTAHVSPPQKETGTSENDGNEVVQVPLGKTLDEAKAEGLYFESETKRTSSSNNTYRNTETGERQTGGTSSGNRPAQSNDLTAVSGEGLDANTVSQLRSHGIREGDLSKIDRMVADGFDPKEIAQSLRKNGNPNLASVMEQVPRKPKKEDKTEKKEKDKDKETQKTPAGDKKEDKKNDDEQKQTDKEDTDD